MVPMVYQILDLVPVFLKVHGWSLWFALCNTFSPHPTNLKVLEHSHPFHHFFTLNYTKKHYIFSLLFN
ncbi:hypothetical protein Hanom_Chr12g01164941 [Helianthus anomalus]